MILLVIYIYDTDSAINERQLTQFRQLSYLHKGSKIIGHTRCVLLDSRMLATVIMLKV